MPRVGAGNWSFRAVEAVLWGSEKPSLLNATEVPFIVPEELGRVYRDVLSVGYFGVKWNG